MKTERIVLIASILINIFQVVSDEAHEWVALSKQSSADSEKTTLHIDKEFNLQKAEIPITK